MSFSIVQRHAANFVLIVFGRRSWFAMSFCVTLAFFLMIGFVCDGTEAQKLSKNVNSLKFAKFSGPSLSFLFWLVFLIMVLLN